MATASGTAPAWFRIVALLAIAWNGFGLAMYLSAVGLFGDPTAGLSEAERAAASSIPSVVLGAFGVGTVAGILGSVGLFLGKRWAWPVLLVSLVALLVLEGWIVFVSDAWKVFGLAVPISVTLIAIFLAWTAHGARKRGWLS